MTNYFISYDLNGLRPTHDEMDQHLKRLGSCTLRVLETVWFVPSSKSRDQMFQYVKDFVSGDDGVLVIEAADCAWDELLVPDAALQECWDG